MDHDPGYAFLIGAPKSGTTSVGAWLDASPHVALSSVKEPRHFTDFAARVWHRSARGPFVDTLAATRDAYEATFRPTGATRWKLDASTDYLSCAASPDLIAAFARDHDVRVIAILRDPVDRVVSEHRHTVRDGLQADTLAQSLDAEEHRVRAGWHPLFYHLARSRYDGPITRYADLLGDRLLVVDYHTLAEPDGGRDRIASFLGLDLRRSGEMPRLNGNGIDPMRNAALAAVVRSSAAMAVARAAVPVALRQRVWDGLTAMYGARYEPAARDIDRIRGALAGDIEACVANPLIPTEHWCTAIPGSGGVPDRHRSVSSTTRVDASVAGAPS